MNPKLRGSEVKTFMKDKTDLSTHRKASLVTPNALGVEARLGLGQRARRESLPRWETATSVIAGVLSG